MKTLKLVLSTCILAAIFFTINISVGASDINRAQGHSFFLSACMACLGLTILSVLLISLQMEKDFISKDSFLFILLGVLNFGPCLLIVLFAISKNMEQLFTWPGVVLWLNVPLAAVIIWNAFLRRPPSGSRPPMSMEKVLANTILVYSLIGLLVLAFFGNGRNYLAIILAIVFCVVILAFGGLVIGMFLAVIVRRPAKDKIVYLSGQLIAFIFCWAMIISLMNQTTRDSRNRSLAEENRRTIESTNGPGTDAIKLAFDKLSDRIPERRQLELQSTYMSTKDTVIAGIQDTLFTVYLTYTLENKETPRFYSKYQVFYGFAKEMEFNKDTRDPEYRAIDSAERQEERLSDSLEKTGN